MPFLIGETLAKTRTIITPRENDSTILMAIGNEGLMHERSPEHFRIETTRIKYDKDSGEFGKKKILKMEKSTGVTKKRSPDGLTV